MSYFLPSFIQKRLLKYALSRLGIVDTDALDPDNLGIRWGQRSTVELRDIGLKLEKLTTLLNIPPNFELLSARVHLLRITVPADIYSSGIACEACGINVHIRVLPDEAAAEKNATSSPQSSSSNPPEDERILPDATNLAHSFLETEPTEEKKELQAALSSQSHILHRSNSSTDDEDEELGLGNETLSLPSFVAGFLRGVADRFQLKIKNVAVRLDMELKQDGPSKRYPENKPDLVSGLLTVGEVDVHGTSEFTAGRDEPLPVRAGKRLVACSGIDFGLISDSGVFRNYARFTVPASPATTMRSKDSQSPERTFSPPPFQSSDSDLDLAMTRSTIFEPSYGPNDGEDSEQDNSDNTSHGHIAVDWSAAREHAIGQPTSPISSNGTPSHDGRFSDAASEDEFTHHTSLDDSRESLSEIPFLDNPDYLESVIDTQFDDFDEEPPAPLRPRRRQITESLSNPENLLPENQCHQNHRDEAGAPESFDLEEVAEKSIFGESGSRDQYQIHSEPVGLPGSHDEMMSCGDVDGSLSQTGLVSSIHLKQGSQSDGGSVSSEQDTSGTDLMESQYFSHDEAQSLYMSALSQGGSFAPRMPGAWESTHPQSSTGSCAQTTEDEGVPTAGQDPSNVSTPRVNEESTRSYFEERVDQNHFSSRSVPTDRSPTPTPSLPVSSTSGEQRKPILSVDKVLIWLPSNLSEVDSDMAAPKMPAEQTDSDPRNVSSREPTYEDSMLASRAYAAIGSPNNLNEPYLSLGDSNDGISGNKSIAVEIFTISIQFDIAIGWLLIKAGQYLSSAFGGRDDGQRKQSGSSEQPTLQASLRVDTHSISVNFVEHVVEESYVFPHTFVTPPFSPDQEGLILQVKASLLAFHMSTSERRTVQRLDISTLTFGTSSEQIISFNEGLKMRTSTRDFAVSSQNDIHISLTKSADAVKVDVSTLPLHINLNIHHLEEVLGWMGGLSSILELGSSISSTSTMKGAPEVSKKRPRAVHFETPAFASLEEKRVSVPWKVNARLGGVVVDVIGESHYINLSTTAIKVVSRFEGVGVQIDKARLTGPHLVDNSSDPPAKLTLSNIRVEFLFSPKEIDLDRLLTIITPSKDRYDDDDDIMVDTLLRQRRQGSVLRVTISGMKTVISNVSSLAPLKVLGSELARLSTVTKYLPEDDRPGILTLTLVRDLETQVHLGTEVGDINCRLTNAEVAWISMPSLVATQIETIAITRNRGEELIGEALMSIKEQGPAMSHPPIFMARFIPDEMDPTFKIKLQNLRVEYTISSVLAFMGLSESVTGGELASEMANSITNLADRSGQFVGSSGSPTSEIRAPSSSEKPIKIAVVFQDCVLGLNPRNSPAKALVVLTNSKFGGAVHGDESSEANLDIRKASILIIDDTKNEGSVDNLRQRTSAVTQSDQVQEYISLGYVPVSSLSTATAAVKIMRLAEDGSKSLDVELKNRLLILETCADSTQTLINILNGLQPPTPPSVAVKYRTEVTPLQDMLASFSGNDFDAEVQPARSPEGTAEVSEVNSDELEYVSEFYPKGYEPPDATASEPPEVSASGELADSFQSNFHVSSSLTELDFQEDHFAKSSAVGGTAHRWDTAENTYGLSNDQKLHKSPLRVRVRDVHVIWNLFDGFDWQRTRDTISKAVEEVEMKATERRARTSRMFPAAEEEEESVIGDFLFNSIYIGIPANKDPRELHREINRDINDLSSETGSYATSTTVTGVTPRQGRSTHVREKKKLRLHRSKHHKMTFELSGICADLVVFPPGSEETQSSLDVRIKDLEVFDHVPTSTWKKFATYLHEAGERESGTSMIHLEILTVKPIPELAASEIVLKATVLPLRLHVDQDALDFMSRFFEFRDASVEASPTPADAPFLQRVEVNAIQVKLDFKPKRVDYAGLRSGRTTEFMNFFVLDGSDLVLRHVIIYGVSGFDRLGITLNDIWTPDVKANQLPGVLAGLAPIRSLVNVGGGVRQLFVVPMREYQKDGRIVRSIQKGAVAFAKTTSSELVKLGAKLAIGTQTVLQGAEDLLASPQDAAAMLEEDHDDDGESNKISPYAEQPLGVVQGLRGAFRGLERDLLLARDAVVAVPGEVVESGNAKDAAKAVLRRAPTLILRPAIGVSKAVGQTLLGAGNSLDPSNRRKMEDKYKRH
ncbi:Autophagy-related protein 2 [Penicillium oxalicum]|uniref:Autophagy-related protein 2 n=1 Tax=Penicillium oxalicum TaxID=69781 RepID=UPI0020B83962|nr:Autophagy-related protein 2 [Penicillium oxalicum]KAI2795216.1 Autophagy-related protein 2 [Penicillium oxalicum]